MSLLVSLDISVLTVISTVGDIVAVCSAIGVEEIKVSGLLVLVVSGVAVMVVLRLAMVVISGFVVV